MPDNRSEHHRSPLSAFAGTVRTIIADGQRWVVREVSAPAFDRRGGTHLVFWCDTVMRRLRFFPANWHQLSDEELYALTEHIDADSGRASEETST